jgi:hypothetical protein
LSSPYLEAGYKVTSSGSFCYPQTPPSGTSDFYAGKKALANCNANGINTLTRVDGGTFTFSSIDLAPFANSYGGSARVTFTGTKADLSTVTETVHVSSLFVFTTYRFTGFDNVISVSWQHVAPYHQFSDIVVDWRYR